MTIKELIAAILLLAVVGITTYRLGCAIQEWLVTADERAMWRRIRRRCRSYR